MTPDLLLHEMPIMRALFKRLRCLLKGGHKHIYIGRAYVDTSEDEVRHYILNYICKHCRHCKWEDEYERNV